MSSKLLILESKTVGQSTQSGNTERCFSLLAAKKAAYVTVDGSDEAQKPVRDLLFGLSGIRGNYPQVFKIAVEKVVENGMDTDGVTFVGSWDDVEKMNEMNEIPPEVLEANPDIVTLNQMLSDVQKI